ncbi:uncharacterized protein LOC128632760 [Ictalurus punctatus]|uniref:Uncharacterized protein LOC128632760 n=1 Tax=Ictalurus punctatus TaxID=7998 RepID=A0A9F7TJU6_ICTPU|nr:uncharacterized protein LOC128632760 [Ictalurus punctatus]
MDYYFQDGTTKTPAAFLNELKPVLGNVLIRIRLVFKNLTRVPSEADVLNAANALLDSKIRRRRSLVIQTLSDPVSIQNVIYEKIGNNSYIISFAFQITNVTISKDLQLRNGTYDLIQNTINSLLNTILNVKDAPAFVFPQANYTFNGTAIEANFEYIFVEGETKWTPSGFLSANLNISELSTFTTPAAQTESTVHVVLRPTTLVVVQTRMLFNSSCPVPSESLVLRAIQTLLSAQLTNLTDSVNRLNFTYEKISETSYAVFFTLSISNISMSKNAELRNDTYTQVENIINNALNTLLNDAGAAPFEPQSSFFTSSGNQVNGDMEYYFQDGDTKTPAAFLDELTPVLGNVLIRIRLVFKNLTRVPSEADVLNAANALLDSKIRRAQCLITANQQLHFQECTAN